MRILVSQAIVFLLLKNRWREGEKERIRLLDPCCSWHLDPVSWSCVTVWKDQHQCCLARQSWKESSWMSTLSLHIQTRSLWSTSFRLRALWPASGADDMERAQQNHQKFWLVFLVRIFRRQRQSEEELPFPRQEVSQVGLFIRCRLTASFPLSCPLFLACQIFPA